MVRAFFSHNTYVKGKPTKMKKILVPTDFSECAGYAEHAAIQLARQAKAEIHFFHMMGVPPDWIGMELNEDRLYASVNNNVNRVNKQLDDLVALAEKSSVKAKKMLQYEVSFNDILSYIQKAGVDFVVMGSHGVSGVGDFLVGSNTQKMSRFCTVPLMVINRPVDEFQIKTIVFATDLDNPKSAFNKNVAEFARLFGASVHGLFVNTPFVFLDTPTSNAKAEEYCSNEPELFESFTIYSFKTQEGGILSFAKDVDADVIVMVTESKGGLARAFEKSVTESVIRFAKTPVLSFNSGI